MGTINRIPYDKIGAICLLLLPAWTLYSTIDSLYDLSRYPEWFSVWRIAMQLLWACFPSVMSVVAAIFLWNRRNVRMALVHGSIPLFFVIANNLFMIGEYGIDAADVTTILVMTFGIIGLVIAYVLLKEERSIVLRPATGSS